MVREPYHSERERADVADAEPAALGGSHGTVVKREASHARLPLSSFRPIYIAGVRVSRDHFLPPDPQAFLAAEPPTGRVVVIAPTRAACETIELALGLNIDTLLEREHGGDIHRLAASGDRKSTRLNSSHLVISYAVFCLKKKKNNKSQHAS